MTDFCGSPGLSADRNRENVTVSIAMATYNGARFVADQLTDLAAQTLQPDELVVCDDGSHDETLKLVMEFASRAPFPVHVHANDRTLGYRANFMNAALLCQGDIVCFCDQDDRWKEEKIEALVRCFQDPEILLVSHQAELIDSNGKPDGGLLYKSPAAYQRIAPLAGSPWVSPLGLTQAFRRSLLKFSYLWPASLDPTTASEPLAHDQWFAFLAGALGTTAYCPKVLVQYRQHEANTFGAKSFNLPWRERISRRIRDAEMSIERRMASAAKRSEALQSIAALANPGVRERATSASRAYDKLMQSCAQRLAIYRRTGFAGRLSALVKLLADGGYGAHPWKFGFGALALDISRVCKPAAGSGMSREGRAAS